MQFEKESSRENEERVVAAGAILWPHRHHRPQTPTRPVFVWSVWRILVVPQASICAIMFIARVAILVCFKSALT